MPIEQITVSSLSAISAINVGGKQYVVTDGLTATDCTVGGGTFQVLVQSNGHTWTSVSESAPISAIPGVHPSPFSLLNHNHPAVDVLGVLSLAQLPIGSSGVSVCVGNDSRLSDSRVPNGSAGGQLGGTFPNPDVRGLRETGGPTSLTLGAVGDGQYLRRSGVNLVGATLAGGGDMVKATYDPDADGIIGAAQLDASLIKAGDARLLANIERTQRVFSSQLTRSGTFLLISGTAYFVYLGRLVQSLTPKFVEFQVTTIGAGAQTAEVGLFSTPNPPSKAAQSLTKLVSTGTVDALTSTGVKRNTSAFATPIAAGIHLWAGIRTAMATTQPTLGPGLSFDRSQGNILSLVGAGVLTGAGPFSGALIAVSANVASPDLTVTLD